MTSPTSHWMEQARRCLHSPDARVGSGKLVLVVGPSGAGKDTLIERARRICGNDPAVVFPRRVVTRPSAVGEDHESVDEQEFERRAGAGRFALAWRAHGLRYGISCSIDETSLRGHTVVCNVSRTIVVPARARYVHVVAVLITASPDVLAQRLAGRGRETAEAIAARLARAAEVEQNLRPDIVIDNSGPPQHGAKLLADAIYRRPFPIGL